MFHNSSIYISKIGAWSCLLCCRLLLRAHYSQEPLTEASLAEATERLYCLVKVRSQKRSMSGSVILLGGFFSTSGLQEKVGRPTQQLDGED